MKLIKSGRYGDHAGPVLVLAHGAGAGADSEFMEALARALDGVGVASVRFEFPYMEQRRLDGRDGRDVAQDATWQQLTRPAED